MCAKVAWARVIKLIEINVYCVEGLLKNFDEHGGLKMFSVDGI